MLCRQGPSRQRGGGRGRDDGAVSRGGRGGSGGRGGHTGRAAALTPALLEVTILLPSLPH